MKLSFILAKFFFRIFFFGFVLGTGFGCNQKKNDTTVLTQDNDSIVAITTSNKELREVTFLPYWVTNAQFAGYFVAEEKGIYEKYGIKINIIPFIPFVTSSDLLVEEKADFAAIWLANAIELKASGIDLVNIAQPSSRSSLMLITKKSSGIDSIHKMNGKRAGVWSGFELQPRVLFDKYNLDVDIVPIGSSNNLFLMDGVEIINASWYDEYHSIINSGYEPEELNIFFFADYGLNFLEDGIYCLSKTMKNEPELCRNFINATLEGWRYAFSHEDETIDIVVNRVKKENLPVNRIHQEWMFERYRDMYLPEGITKFHNDLSESDYDFVGKVLLENKQISKIPEFDQFYQPFSENK